MALLERTDEFQKRPSFGVGQDPKPRKIVIGIDASTPSKSHEAAGALDFRSFTRRLQPAPASEPIPLQEPRPDPKASLALLDDVAAALPALIEEIRDLKEQLRSAKASETEWENLANAKSAQIEGLEQNLTDAMRRAETVEDQLKAERLVAEQFSHQAAEAECLSTLFHNKLLFSFGPDSMAQTAIEIARNRTTKGAI